MHASVTDNVNVKVNVNDNVPVNVKVKDNEKENDKADAPKKSIKKGKAKKAPEKVSFPQENAEKLWSRMWNQHFFQYLQICFCGGDNLLTVTFMHKKNSPKGAF